MRAKLANWTDISDVALLKGLRNSEEWLRWLCIELLRENVAFCLSCRSEWKDSCQAEYISALSK